MTTTLRIDEGLKKECDSVLDDIGLNLSCAITIFLKELARRRAIPFELRADSVPGYSWSAADSDAFTDSLNELPEKYGKADWDGYGANPISQDSYRAAKVFADRMPRGLKWATVDVDADGDVCFEWYKAKDRQCSFTFSSVSKIHCVIKDRGRKMIATFDSPNVARLCAMVAEVFNG